ncbi:MAG: 50S ribosomal protein L24 [Pseudomonadales bacterium]|nr:50S ribosomal protein L24 [Pseudomonadales bacterium]
MLKIKKNDEVVVIAGRDKGKRGRVLSVLANGKYMVQGINMVKKHQKSNPQKGITGGILDKEAAIAKSNVALYNHATAKADKVGFKLLDDGKKIRIFKSNNEAIDA